MPDSADPLGPRELARRRYAVIAVLVLVSMSSQFLRNSHAVMAPDIAAELGLPIASLGVMGGALFLAAAVCQIPFGTLFDALGTRPVITAKLLIAGAGALAFGAAESLQGLVVGRMLMGVGSAALIMGALVIASRWFEPRVFGTIVGLALGLSHVGNLLSTTPMSLLVEAIGWRHAFVAIAALLAAVSVVFCTIVRDAPPGHPFHDAKRETLATALRGVLEVLRIPGLARVMAMGFVAYAACIAVLGLWAGPFLRDRFGLDTVQRGHVLLLMVSGMVAGNFLFGFLDRAVHSRKRLVYFGAASNIAILIVLAMRASTSGLLEVSGLFAALGMLSCYSVILIAHGRALYPDHLIGRGMTAMNTAVLLGAAALQVISGHIARYVGSPEGGPGGPGYAVIFGFLAASVAVGMLIYRSAPESHGDAPRPGSAHGALAATDPDRAAPTR